MKKTTILGTAAAVALLSAGTAAYAQQGIGATGALDADQQNEDLIDAIEDDAERDLDRFGNTGLPQGLSGSFALRANLQDGNTDAYDLGIGTDLNYLFGPNGIELQLNYSYGEEDGTTTDESLVYALQYTRDINPRLYGFARLQGSFDEFSSFQSDTFLSFGAGYRVIATEQTQWDVQAGVGYRYAEFNFDTALDPLTDDSFDEPAIGIGSNYSQRLSPTMILTNDTDIIYSDTDTVVFNDLAVSMSMTDSLSLRTSLLTEYHTDPQPGFEDTDNTLGVSVVYSY
ncbi:DUF481 domain-containing protein [Wenxinia saemankumensis]|uniref:Putative salt-induced outer membrane protein n=1 Tax=Wenxinia saemankumensis TaxID=1447782 RepID=A0A1M6GVF2_9RHOB|nr:DUF481 domain-containing protein [Wenxinia saemankumensis]SHJ13918.1 putative salt-induced outer membrane protein [Wenxinia saemankumensis]